MFSSFHNCYSGGREGWGGGDYAVNVSILPELLLWKDGGGGDYAEIFSPFYNCYSGGLEVTAFMKYHSTCSREGVRMSAPDLFFTHTHTNIQNPPPHPHRNLLQPSVHHHHPIQPWHICGWLGVKNKISIYLSHRILAKSITAKLWWFPMSCCTKAKGNAQNKLLSFDISKQFHNALGCSRYL